jgi:hypothetical protein
MMKKTEWLINDLWRDGLARFPQYASAETIFDRYMAERTEGMRKPSRHALIVVLVRFFGFRECGFLHEGRKLYYNPWHPDSTESQDDTKLIYPGWLERD